MKIAIYSPVRRQGSTSLSILLGTALAAKTTLKTCLTYTGTESDTFNMFLGLRQYADRTKSINQMIKMLQANAISGEDISDYLHKVVENIDLMHTSSDKTKKEESEILLSYILSHLPHNLVITDVNSEPYEETTQKVLGEADLVVVVLSQGVDVIDKFKRWKESSYFPDPSKVVYVINRYDANVSAIRNVCKLIGVKYNKVAKLSMNPMIRKQSNEGKLGDLMTYILERDIRVIELANDMRDIALLVGGNLGIRINWKE